MIVEGVNRIKRHTKVVNQGGRAGTTGGIVTQEAAIHVSNVMLLVDAPKGSDAKGKVTTRVGFTRAEVTKRRSDGSTYAARAARASPASPVRRSDDHHHRATRSVRVCRPATARRSSPRCRSSSTTPTSCRSPV